MNRQLFDRVSKSVLERVTLCGAAVAIGCLGCHAEHSVENVKAVAVSPLPTEVQNEFAQPEVENDAAPAFETSVTVDAAPWESSDLVSAGNIGAQENQESQEDAGKPNDEQESLKGILGRASDVLGRATRSSTDSAKNAGKWVQDKLGGAADSTSNAAQETVNWANQTFESLREQGMTSASSTSEWLVEDWNNMESWEYKIISSSGLNDEQLESKLNELGVKGWECFDITGNRLMLKKRRESYLRRLPFRDLIRLAPLMNNNGNQ